MRKTAVYMTWLIIGIYVWVIAQETMSSVWGMMTGCSLVVWNNAIA